MSDYVHFIHSFRGAGPSPNRSTGCDSCKIRRKKCPLRFDSEGRCHECQRLGIQCVRDHPPWLDDPDCLNSFKRNMRRAVKRNRQNRHRTSPRETVSVEMGTFVQPHSETTLHSLRDGDYSYSEATFVHNSHDRTAFIPSQTADAAAQCLHQAVPAAQSFQQADGQIPFHTTPYHSSRISLPTLPITSTPNIVLRPFPEVGYHYPQTADLANISPHCTRVPLSVPPDPQLQLFVDHLRHYYPRVRHVIIEADNEAPSINALAAEAARINRTTPTSSLIVSVLGC